MLKRWHESRRFTFEAVFIFFYMTIPYVDAYFITPKMKCEGQITDEQVKRCTSWIIKKETKYVPKSPKTSGGMYRGIETDSQLPRKGQGNLFNGFETPL